MNVTKILNRGKAASTKGSRLFATTIGLVQASMMPSGQAEAATGGKEASDSVAYVIEEVIVTARKREESLQDVPISIAAFSSVELEARSLNSLRDVGQFTPNFSFLNHAQLGDSSGIAFIRGAGQTDPAVFADPGVGVYVDGVYMGRSQGTDLDLMDIDRVEVLRGPQGTLFGKNTIGGAVNIVSIRPTDEFLGSAEIITGRFNRFDGKASINIPLVPGKLAVKIAGATRNRDGYGRRLDYFTGDKLDEMGNVDSLGGRALLRWTPTEKVDVLLSVDASKVRQFGPVRKLVATSAPPIISLLNRFLNPDYGDAFLTADEFTSFATAGNVTDLDTLGVALTVDWDLGPWSVKSITSYRDLTSLAYSDSDGSPYNIIGLNDNIDQDQFSQELQLSGISLGGRLTWVGGLYYFTENAFEEGETNAVLELRNIIGLDASTTRDIWNDATSYAVFGQGTYAISDKLSLTAGLRYTYEEKTVARTRFRHYSGVVTVPLEERSGDWDAFSPRVGFEYRWNDEAMTYVSVAQGFKSGGLNARSETGTAFLPYDPESNWNYEVGLKSELLDHRLRFNISVFYNAYKNIQFQVSRADPVTLARIAIMDNVARAKVQGFETEVTAALSPNFTLSAGIGHTDARYTEADPDAPVNENTKFVNTPKWNVNLSGQYVVPLGGMGQLTARLDYAYKTKIYNDHLNTPLISQDSYGLLNARLTFLNAGGDWSVSVFGTNLTDETYILAGTEFLNALGFAEVQNSRPREWGLSFKYQF